MKDLAGVDLCFAEQKQGGQCNFQPRDNPAYDMDRTQGDGVCGKDPIWTSTLPGSSDQLQASSQIDDPPNDQTEIGNTAGIQEDDSALNFLDTSYYN